MFVTSINEFSTVWAEALWRATWQGGVALTLILVLGFAMRKIPAYVKCWLWRLAFFKLLIAGLWTVPLEFACLPQIGPFHPPSFELLTDKNSPQIAVTELPISLPNGQPAPRREAIAQHSAMSWLLVAWALGVTLALANLARHWRLARQICSSLTQVTDERLVKCVIENCRRMSLNRQPELRISQASGSPFLVGIVRPVIVLPSVFVDSCSDEELNTVLLHELAHIKRCDLLWNWLPVLAEAVFFFHPLVWLVKREWRLAQEIATDELAVSLSRVKVSQYARSLLELVARYPTTVSPLFAVTVNETYSQLSRRLIAMQAFHKLTTTRRIALATAVFAIAIFGIVPWKLTHQEAQAQSGQAQETITQAVREKHSTKNEEATRSITIRVVDADGKPLKGAQVFRNHVYKPKDSDRPKIENKNYLTDADGKAIVALSGTSVDLRLWARKTNFIPLHAMWAKQFQTDGDRIPAEFTFQLQLGTEIGGIVRNEQGEPIEGVKVEVMDATAQNPVTLNEPGKRPVRDCYLAEDEDVVTDTQGRWKLGNVPPEESLVFTFNDPFILNAAHDELSKPKLLVRLSHPDYTDVANDAHYTNVNGWKEWGRLQQSQQVTHESLRDQSAVFVLKRRHADQTDR
jgi:beta-lactamase regulating signal transducer with metallopeptidase domain